jgi:hypothetical protein
MAADQKTLSRRQVEEKIVALAWKDEAFRKAFLADPKKQFEEKLGTRLPADLKITAWAEDENHLHFVIPAKPKVDIGQLSDADLEKVAGGVDLLVTAVVSLTAGMVGLGTAMASLVGGTEWDKGRLP